MAWFSRNFAGHKPQFDSDFSSNQSGILQGGGIIHAMSTDKLPRPIIVDQPQKLHNMIRAFQKEPILAVDTESNSLYAYQEQVCLLQFSIPGQDYLVDPLACKDLSPLGPIFGDPKIEKIFHAAEYDLIMLDQDFGFSFNNLFDTMVAARILGWRAVGLGSILKAQFGVHVQKKYQRANWGKRPLPPEMLTYAQLDTHYLIRLRNLQKAELEKADRWAIAEEDFLRACQVDSTNHCRDGADCFRIHGARDLEPRQLAVLQEICIYRDQIAQSMNRPLFKVINNNTLLNIAIASPQTLDELAQVDSFSSRQVRWIGRGVVSAVRNGLQAQPPKIPHNPRPSDAYLLRVDKLRKWRKNTARSMGVESDVVMPKDLLYQMAEEHPKTRAALDEILETVPWRRERYAAQLLDLLAPRRK